MELDDFKSQLNNMFGQPGTEMTGDELSLMLHQQSGNVVSKIRRNMAMEIISSAVLVAALGVFAVMIGSDLVKIAAGMSLVVIVIQAAGFWWQGRDLSRTFPPGHANLKESLIYTLAAVERFIRLYTRFSLVAYIVGLVLGGYVGVYTAITDKEDPAFAAITWTGWGAVGFAFGVLLLLSVGCWYFLKWWVAFNYGKYLKELKNCLQQLNSL